MTANCHSATTRVDAEQFEGKQAEIPTDNWKDREAISRGIG